MTRHLNSTEIEQCVRKTYSSLPLIPPTEHPIGPRSVQLGRPRRKRIAPDSPDCETTATGLPTRAPEPVQWFATPPVVRQACLR